MAVLEDLLDIRHGKGVVGPAGESSSFQGRHVRVQASVQGIRG